MGLFNNKTEGGFMDVIRCDEKKYLIWKWSPGGVSSRKENAIRYGSSLRVKDGEVAVFVYRQKDGTMQDFIEGPYDQTIKTANFPVLTSIVGTAFGSASPFQAEIYFINLAGNIQLSFFIPKFDVADPRNLDYTAPVTVKGTIMFKIADYRSFIKLNRMIDFELEEFYDQIKAAVRKYAKGTITNAPSQLGIPLIQIERGIESINELVQTKLQNNMQNDFGILIKRVDISDIEIDKDSDAYRELKAVTSDLQTETLRAQTTVHIQNLTDMQTINAENQAEALRIMREETQRQQRLQTEAANLTAHQIDVQGDVAKTAATSLGQLGSNAGSGMGNGGGGMNPAAMMTGMMMGGAVGGSMSNMIGNMTQGMNQPQPPSPPATAIATYHLSVNGAQTGPYSPDQLRQMVVMGQVTTSTYVWKAGMAGWEPAANVPEVYALFAAVPPPPPPAPPVPPPPPAPAE
ncbi:MAG: SPFH domain-containing protein [Tannerella sp.]|jgi:membrane protease subunit (stomatin/prohibitin family)|nr:SPFH domain-containing protein [Tannerella sp.]